VLDGFRFLISVDPHAMQQAVVVVAERTDPDFRLDAARRLARRVVLAPVRHRHVRVPARAVRAEGFGPSLLLWTVSLPTGVQLMAEFVVVVPDGTAGDE
jgi:hypothetical protein